MKFKLSKGFYIPVIFFIIAFLADATITTYGLSLGAQEGNQIVIWLWDIFGKDSFLLKILYIIFVIAGSYLLAKRNYLLGLWAIYSFAWGHLFGFLTWVTLMSINTAQLIILAMTISLVMVLIISKKVKS